MGQELRSAGCLWKLEQARGEIFHYILQKELSPVTALILVRLQTSITIKINVCCFKPLSCMCLLALKSSFYATYPLAVMSMPQFGGPVVCSCIPTSFITIICLRAWPGPPGVGPWSVPVELRAHMKPDCLSEI